MEADIFVNDNYMPFPSQKYANDNEYIVAFQKFLKTGILPLVFMLLFPLIGCKDKNTFDSQSIKPYTHLEYQKNDILTSKDDTLLNTLDTTLYFSDIKLLYKIIINKNKVNLKAYRWKELPDNITALNHNGYQENGFIYMKDDLENDKYTISYKIVLNKGLFIWNGQNWLLVNPGDT